MSLFGGPPDIAQLKKKRDVRGLIKALRYRRSPPPGYDPLKKIYSAARSGGGIVKVGYDDGYSVRSEALEALIGFGSEAMPVLIEALDDKSDNVRKDASKALVQLMDKRAVDPLFSKLDDPVVQENAIAVLAHFGDTRAIKKILHRIGTMEISIKQDPNDSLPWQNQRKALSFLKEFDLAWLPIGLSCISDRDLPLRVGAAVALGQAHAPTPPWPGSGDPEVAKALLSALDDPELVVRKSSAQALSYIVSQTKDPNLAENLLLKFSTIQKLLGNLYAVGHLAKALAVIKGRQIWGTIRGVACELANSPDIGLRIDSIEILIKMSSPEATEILQRLSKDHWNADEGILLSLAVLRDNKDLVEFLISKGADINATSGEDGTELHKAARVGNKDMVEFLVSKGADVNAKDEDGRTPLALAVKQRKTDMVELLKNLGATE